MAGSTSVNKRDKIPAFTELNLKPLTSIMNTMETAPLLLQSFPSYCTSGLVGLISEELTKNKVLLIQNPKMQFHLYLENYLKIKL